MAGLKTRYYVAIAIAIAVIGYGAWFFSYHSLFNGDWAYYNLLSQKQLLRLPSIWDGRALGSINISASFYPTDLLWGTFARFTNFAVSERIIFLWPSIIIAAAGSFLFLKTMSKFRIAALIGSFVYTYNDYFMILRTGDLTLAVAYALAPIVLLTFISALERRNFRVTIVCALLSWIASFYEFRIFYITTWVMVAYVIFTFAFIRRNRAFVNDAAKYSLPVFIIVGLIDSYWLLGLTKLGQLTTNSAFSNVLFGSQYYNLSEALALFHPFWTINGPTIFNAQPIPFYDWLLPILALYGLILNRRKPFIAFFGLVGIFGILLTKQTSAPFVNIYLWLFEHAPGFNAFREASKFYALIALSYSVLIGSVIDWSVQHWDSGYRKRFLLPALVCVVAVLMLINIKPLLEGEMGTLYVSRFEPQDYVKLNALIGKTESQFFRTVWLPGTSPWGLYSNSHPALDVSSEVGGDWLNLFSGLAATSNPDQVDANVLGDNFTKDIMSLSSVKYVIVPLRDIANDDDFFHEQNRQYYVQILNSLPWLRRINIGTKYVQVYQNISYSPYISTMSIVLNLSSLLSLEQKYNFITRQLRSEFAFAPPGGTEPAEKLTDPFESPSRTSYSSNALSSRIPNNTLQTAYINTNQGALSYQIIDDFLTFNLTRNVGLSADKSPIGPQINQTISIDRTALRPTGEFVLAQGANLTPINLTSSAVRNLGVPTTTPIVYSVQAGNLVNNPTLENGLWQPVVEDCNDYDSSPIIGQSLVTDPDNPTKVLELTASRHTACTGPDPVSVTAGENLILSFDYRVVKGDEAGYQLVWGGSDNSTTLQYLPVTDPTWRTFRTLVTVPVGANSLRVKLEAFPNDETPVQGVDRYTNIRISSLTEVDSPPIITAPQYVKVPIPTGTKTLSVSDSSLTGKNLVPDPSFASGLWQNTVGDCNNYDDNGDIAMKLDTKDRSVGSQSLELDAKRHIACTGPDPINVEEGQTYLLSFDYQSPNSKTASYSVSFNDANHTSVSNNSITIPDKNWHTFNQTFTVPFGATQASLTVNADAADPPTTTIINRYDNFRLVEIPNVAGQYYITSGGGQTLHVPSKITYTLVNPTKKLIHITGATTPFYLTMSEAYHPQWRLELANSKSQGGLASWIPWIHPDAVSNTDHFDLDDFLNGWYVDPAQLCHDHASGCTINANGSYNIQMIAEFAPQRWFYIGLVISVTTLFGCIGYLLYCWRRKWGVAIQWTSRIIGNPQAWLAVITRRNQSKNPPPVDAIRRPKHPK